MRGAANGLWRNAASFCTYWGTTKHQETKANSDTFGYRFNTWLWVRGVVSMYSPVTKRYSYGILGWKQHEAGFSTFVLPGAGWQDSPSWAWSLTGSNFYSRSYIEVYGGDWNWVRISTAPASSGGWCYWR